MSEEIPPLPWWTSMTKGIPMGPPGRECTGDGTCLPARLHTRGIKCSCGAEGQWDHATDNAEEAFCLECGEVYEE